MVGSCVHAHVSSPQPRRNLAATSPQPRRDLPRARASLRPLTTDNATECDGVLVLLLENYRCGGPTYPLLIPTNPTRFSPQHTPTYKNNDYFRRAGGVSGEGPPYLYPTTCTPPYSPSPDYRCGGPAYATIVTLPNCTGPATHSSLLTTAGVLEEGAEIHYHSLLTHYSLLLTNYNRRAGGGGGDGLPYTRAAGKLFDS